MSKILLQDFADETKHCVFDVGQHFCVFSKKASENTSDNPKGFFSNEKLGLLRRKTTLIVVFTDGEALHMGIDGMLYNLSDPVIVAHRRRRWFGATHFTLLENARVILNFHYWNGRTDRSGMGGEIFEYAERITKSVESRNEFLKILNGMYEGMLKRIWQELL